MEVEPLLTEYEKNLPAVEKAPLNSQEFKLARDKVIEILEMLPRVSNDSHLERIIKVINYYRSSDILVPLAGFLESVGSEKAFDYLLEMFSNSFEEGCEEYETATACMEAMEIIDKERARKEGVYDHPMLNV